MTPNEADQVELCARQQQEVLQLDQRHRDALRALESKQHGEMLKLQRVHVLQVAALWLKQGRKLGAGLQREVRRG